MDLQKLDINEIREMEAPRMREVEHDIRKEISLARMDIVSNDPSRGHTIRKLRRSLARVKTVQTEKLRSK